MQKNIRHLNTELRKYMNLALLKKSNVCLNQNKQYFLQDKKV